MNAMSRRKSLAEELERQKKRRDRRLLASKQDVAPYQDVIRAPANDAAKANLPSVPTNGRQEGGRADGWPWEITNKLKGLIKARQLSATGIAAVLQASFPGFTTSRSAVLGKAMRIGETIRPEQHWRHPEFITKSEKAQVIEQVRLLRQTKWEKVAAQNERKAEKAEMKQAGAAKARTDPKDKAAVPTARSIVTRHAAQGKLALEAHPALKAAKEGRAAAAKPRRNARNPKWTKQPG